MTARRAVRLTALVLTTIGTAFLAGPVAATTPAGRTLECGSGLNPEDRQPVVVALPPVGLSECGQAIADRQTWAGLVVVVGVAAGLGGFAMGAPRQRRRHKEMAPARPGTRPGARGPKGCPR